MNAQKLAIAIGLIKEKKCCNEVSCNHGVNMGVPIVEIDGVKNIECSIELYHQSKSLKFVVKTGFKYDDDDDNLIMYIKSKHNNDGINKDDILAFSEEILDELPKLRLRVSGNFCIPNNHFETIRAAFEDVFTSIECETIKVNKTDVCSVCYEKTNTKTPCEHPLCNRCWSKIMVCDKNGNNEASCPLCRENIYFV